MILISVVSIGATVLAGKAPLLGLDLKGGVSVVEKPTGRVNSTTLQEAVTIIDNRVNGLGVSNSNVTQQGNNIVIELPGARNDTQVLSVVGETAQLFFRPVECLISPYVPATSTGSTAKTPVATTTTVPAKAKAKAAHKAAAQLHLGAADARLASATFPLAAPRTTTSTGAKSTGAKKAPVAKRVAPVKKAAPAKKAPVAKKGAPVKKAAPVKAVRKSPAPRPGPAAGPGPDGDA